MHLLKIIYKKCNYTVKGYYDNENRYYKKVQIPQKVRIVVSEVYAKYTTVGNKYSLVISYYLLENGNNIGELTLIYDKQGNYIDENWDLDINQIEHDWDC